jgi:hypothetical protein
MASKGGNIVLETLIGTRSADCAYSKRSWKAKIKEWGLKKNNQRVVPEGVANVKEKRKLERDQDSEFFLADNQPAGEKDENFKRKTRETFNHVGKEVIYTHHLIPVLITKVVPPGETCNTTQNLDEEECYVEVFSIHLSLHRVHAKR